MSIAPDRGRQIGTIDVIPPRDPGIGTIDVIPPRERDIGTIDWAPEPIPEPQGDLLPPQQPPQQGCGPGTVAGQPPIPAYTKEGDATGGDDGTTQGPQTPPAGQPPVPQNPGSSGKPKIHIIKYPKKKQAEEGAKHGGEGPPMHHPHPQVGPPHFHETDESGEKIPGRPHHAYPERQV